ncbi:MULTISPECIES: helix-turn-helix domain-containing protein [Enterococcus]|uniref:helix-turn-helix domain-containing protein n=1 Tax=Enterococcus TaxID=1350 RepID=UPI00065E96D0|nr:MULTISPECIES: helix-turn-helix domain-containing protein [Enterococcus]KAF1303961.1 hypothetical protein BAU16_02995 [Enterococcus sp. JM9B]
MNEEYIYTVEDIAKKLEVTPRTIRNYLKSEMLRGKKIGGKWRFSEKELLAFNSVDTDDPHALFFNQKPIETQAMLVIAYVFDTTEQLAKTKSLLLAEFDAVYSGNQRSFYFQKKDDHHAEFTLIGPFPYILRFGGWIEKQLN